MLRNYLKTALRSLLRHRAFSAINIFGLAVSMTLCMAIFMLVADQLTCDRHNTNAGRIYRINSIPVGQDGHQFNETATTTLPLREELQQFSGIEQSVRIMRGFANNWIEIDQNINIPVSGYFVDANALAFFQLELEYGDSRTALNDPYSVVLTKKAAKKLFRQENPVGETLIVKDKVLYKVTGVLKETTTKSHIVFDALASISTVNSMIAAGTHSNDLTNWYQYTSGWIYVQLAEGNSAADLGKILRRVEANHFSSLPNPDVQQKIIYSPQPLLRITPGAFINNPIGPFLPWLFIYFFLGIAAIVLLTSCFNFTNLSIARSLTRAKEIGIRKVTGAMRFQIFCQFMLESVLIALFALVLAYLMLFLLKPLILQMSFIQLMKLGLEENYYIDAVFVAFAILVGILAGLFPALVLSGFQPIKVLKNLTDVKLFSRMRMRKVLLTAQFTFSLIFILTVIVVFNQLALFQRADHGFNLEHKLVVQLNNTAAGPLKNELLKQSNITSVAASSHILASGTSLGESFKRTFNDKDWMQLHTYAVDADYLKNIEVPLVAGKFYDESQGIANEHFIVLNEKAVKTFNFSSPTEAIGEEIILQNDSSRKQVIGVVKNYNHQLLMEDMKPLALMYKPRDYAILQVSYNGDSKKAIESIEAAWSRIHPLMKVDIKDFSEEIHKMYNILFGDLSDILSVISFLAIVISSLGLLGMVIYSTESRRKEVSIRKILGSANGSLVILLAKGFLVILATAVVIAVPAAYFLNSLWLEKMAYHVSVDENVILTGIGILLAFGVITIGPQTWRAARSNPVDNLRAE